MPAARMARPRRRPRRSENRAGRRRLLGRYDRPVCARRAPPALRHLRPDLTVAPFCCAYPPIVMKGSFRDCSVKIWSQPWKISYLYADNPEPHYRSSWPDLFRPSTRPVTMALGATVDVDHRDEPGDDDYDGS